MLDEVLVRKHLTLRSSFSPESEFIASRLRISGARARLRRFDVYVGRRQLSETEESAESLREQAAGQDPSVAHGREVFDSTACVNCHTVRGTVANGRFGPDLTHLMSRETIGAGTALNTPEHLRIWLGDPAVMKPGVLMPAMNLNRNDLDAVAAYMATLK